MSTGAAELRPALTPARVWWLASRPATLAASVAPVLVGTASAVREGPIRPWAGALALLVALAMQVGVNYANDYSDFRRGADTPRRRGPVRAAASGIVPPEQVRWAAVAAFAAAAVAGLVLSLATDPRLIVAGALAVAAGWLYTGGPRPYGYLGLGELFVFLFFGLLATAGTTYVELGRLTAVSVAGGVATGALACAILVLNNLRDIETDREAHKLTLAARIGPAATRGWLSALVAIALLCPFGALLAARSGPLIVLPAITITLALPILRLARRDDAPSLIGALKRMAQLEVWYALLWAVGALAS